MSQDYAARLREVMTDLHGEVGGIERVGRALSEAEMRRADSLRAAAEHVQQAIDALTPQGDEASAAITYRGDLFPGALAAPAALRPSLPGLAYRGDLFPRPLEAPADAPRPPVPGDDERLGGHEFGLSGDDPTRGYRRRRPGTPGNDRGGGGQAGG